ncbi:hypothetical protein Cni_G25224 [Canna indica]|uniref:Uncharacterized protein n=1 Tax=Canna indica TaxID=4628 RepID=A0AAQ3KWM5_9LILI|nr:hypothetical protein Cni_G25224 [Canna indica]
MTGALRGGGKGGNVDDPDLGARSSIDSETHAKQAASPGVKKLKPSIRISTAMTQLTLKLLVDKFAHKVLFVEAGKEVVDFLIGLLEMHVASIIKVLTMERMSTIGNLYKSMRDLDDSFLLPKNSKSLLLNPSCPTSLSGDSLLLLPPPESSARGGMEMSCKREEHKEEEEGNVQEALP